MTRFLSEALGAPEPAFSQGITQLERAAGGPNTDIRLTNEIMQRMRGKIAALGLDPADTTGPELYNALHQRLRNDEATVRQALGIPEDAAADDIMSRVQQFLEKNETVGNVFALKSSVAKRLLKKKIPKVAMKRLGYRSVDSMLKHEQTGALYAAALMSESDSWQRAFREQYATLSSSDFEMRPITILQPKTKRWQDMAATFAASVKHTVLTFTELGTVVLLPLNDRIDGLATTTLLLTLEEMNGIRSYSSYAKLQQVQPDFGKVVQEATVSEPLTAATIAGQVVPWRMIQRYYARFTDAYHPEVFEPHVQSDDLQWHAPEGVIASIEPSLEFWRDTQCLGFLHEGTVVSCNILDVALSYCNHLPFADRIVHFVRDNVWHELMMRYLNQDNLERAVHQQLSNKLANPLALAEQEAYNET